MRIATALALTLALTACGRNASTTDGAAKTSGGAAATAGRRGANDPCSLLERSEVEAVMGPLAAPPYRGSGSNNDVEPLPDGSACIYETADFRSIRLEVEWKDGAMLMKAVSLPGRMLATGAKSSSAPPEANAAKTLLPGGVQIDGEWDEANSFGCCRIYALRGDRLITFDFSGWRADTERAVSMLNKALLRLDHPLTTGATTAIDSIRAFHESRPKRRTVCALLTRAEAESVVGPLAGEPQTTKDDTEGCTYRYAQPASKNSPLASGPKELTSLVGALTGGRTGMTSGTVDVQILVQWRNGFRSLADAGLVGGAIASNYAGIPGMPKRTQERIAGGPWDDAMQTSITFTAVKKDVSLAINVEPMLSQEQIEVRRRLVAKMIEKL